MNLAGTTRARYWLAVHIALASSAAIFVQQSAVAQDSGSLQPAKSWKAGSTRGALVDPITITVSSARDTYVRRATPTIANGTLATINIDRKDSGGPAQGLLYFDFIGSGSNRIPAGSTIQSATLTLRTTGDGSGGEFHRMLTSWSEGATWSSLSSGIQTDNVEARSAADFSTGAMAVGSKSFNVKAAVAAWVNGQDNHGWAIIPLGGNNWKFSSREGSTPPTLSVSYTPPGGDPPTATIAVNPSTIASGSTASLTWSSTNANVCNGANFDAVGKTSGNKNVSPSTTTTYSVSCSGDGGTAFASTSLTVQADTSQSLSRRVAASSDDAEESSFGNVLLVSTDLELVEDSTAQTVGMRFRNIQVPNGANITNAFIQFKVDEVSSTSTNLTIRGIASDRTGAFTTSAGNVSSRPRTSASVSWAPASWSTVDAAGSAQRTPNLASIIKEIVGRSGWASGNSLAIVMTGSGKRVGKAYDGGASSAPLLHVEWTTTSSDSTPPAVSITSPSAGASISGTVNLAANATDNVAVQNVQFRLGSTNICAADTSAPYSCALDTTLHSDGTKSLTAVATDTSGNKTTSSAVSVTIDNGTEPPPGTVRVPQDYATIQAGITAAKAGDVVLVAPGTYSGGIKVTKAITLASYFHTTGDKSYINSTTINGGSVGVDVSAVNATVKGFRFTGGSYSLVFRAPGSRALSNAFEYSGSDSISFENVGGTARGNTCIGPGDDCIDVDGATTGLLLEDNVIDVPKDDGIEIRNYPYTGSLVTITMRGNKITGAKEDGIQLIDYPSTQNRRFIIERNLIRNSVDVGLGLMDNGETSEDFRAASMPERIHVFDNTFDGNRYAITGGDNLVAVNNIVSRSSTMGLKNINGSSIVARTLFWNNAQNHTGSNMDVATTKSGDPQYTSSFGLGAGSPGIDAGTASFTFKSEQVLNIPASAYAGSAPDLGRYESGM